MNSKLILLCAIAVAAAPLALAHDPPGTPKNFCEDPSSGEWLVHDYGPVASGFLLYGNEDGNLGGDCNPGFYVTPAASCADSDWSFGSSTAATYVCVNPPAADWDRHNEFAFGGAWLLVNSGLGVPSADPSVGAGTLWCFGAEGHHANFVTVTVTDVVLGAGAEVTVASDTVDLTGTGEGCGDFESDNGATDIGSVTATFPHGLDGSYQVYVTGTQGHIETDGGGGSIPPPVCGPSTFQFQNGVAAATLVLVVGAGREVTSASHNDPVTPSGNTREVQHTGGTGSGSVHVWEVGPGSGTYNYRVETQCNAPFTGGSEVFSGTFTLI